MDRRARARQWRPLGFQPWFDGLRNVHVDDRARLRHGKRVARLSTRAAIPPLKRRSCDDAVAWHSTVATAFKGTRAPEVGRQMTRALAALQAALLSVSSASFAFSQGMPTSQPALIQITREEVKTGHNAMHSAFEAGWPAAYAKAKSPNYYLATRHSASR